jgi:hypothetical protein
MQTAANTLFVGTFDFPERPYHWINKLRNYSADDCEATSFQVLDILHGRNF